jgi:hypothetical protein
MERKVIKRLSNTSYWSDGEGLWLKPNIGGEFRDKDVSVVGGRKWHKDVGFLDSYFKEPFSDIPQMVKKEEINRVKEEIIKPIIEAKEEINVEKVSTGKRGRPRVEGGVSARAMRYRRKACGEAKSSGRPKKAL